MRRPRGEPLTPPRRRPTRSRQALQPKRALHGHFIGPPSWRRTPGRRCPHVQRTESGMRLFLKLFLVLGMTLAILVPLLLIRGVIHDRQGYRAEAVADIARSYGGAQAFAGPVLVVPYTDTVDAEETDQIGRASCRGRGQRRE